MARSRGVRGWNRRLVRLFGQRVEFLQHILAVECALLVCTTPGGKVLKDQFVGIGFNKLGGVFRLPVIQCPIQRHDPNFVGKQLGVLGAMMEPYERPK